MWPQARRAGPLEVKSGTRRPSWPAPLGQAQCYCVSGVIVRVTCRPAALAWGLPGAVTWPGAGTTAPVTARAAVTVTISVSDRHNPGHWPTGPWPARARPGPRLGGRCRSLSRCKGSESASEGGLDAGMVIAGRELSIFPATLNPGLHWRPPGPGRPRGWQSLKAIMCQCKPGRDVNDLQ